MENRLNLAIRRFLQPFRDWYSEEYGIYRNRAQRRADDRMRLKKKK
jgi:hypothetical protein